MPAKDHAAWDVIRALRCDVPGFRRPTAAQRAELRAGVFERAWVDSAEVDPDSIRLAASSRIARMSRGSRGNLWVRARTDVMVMMLVVAIVCYVPVVLLAFYQWWSLPATAPGGTSRNNALAFLVLLASLVFQLIMAQRRNSNVLRRAAAGLCPDCGYDLAASPRERGLDAATLGVDIGPARCPECGAFWPLVPPPGREGSA